MAPLCDPSWGVRVSSSKSTVRGYMQDLVSQQNKPETLKLSGFKSLYHTITECDPGPVGQTISLQTSVSTSVRWSLCNQTSRVLMVSQLTPSHTVLGCSCCQPHRPQLHSVMVDYSKGSSDARDVDSRSMETSHILKGRAWLTGFTGLLPLSPKSKYRDCSGGSCHRHNATSSPCLLQALLSSSCIHFLLSKGQLN